jgi:hypothetical protein
MEIDAGKKRAKYRISDLKVFGVEQTSLDAASSQ